jgi:hypothetical protein
MFALQNGKSGENGRESRACVKLCDRRKSAAAIRPGERVRLTALQKVKNIISSGPLVEDLKMLCRRPCHRVSLGQFFRPVVGSFSGVLKIKRKLLNLRYLTSIL